MMAADQAMPTSSGWFAQATRFTTVETATYLRDKTAIFWTFVYPIVLLVLMMALFGGGSRFAATIDVEGSHPSADRFVAAMEQRFQSIDPDSFSLRRVTPEQETPEGRVRVILPPNFDAKDGSGQSIIVRLDGETDAESGSMLSLVAEAATQLNADLAGAPRLIGTRYEIDAAASRSADASAIYYVVGLAVLAMVSTALFGFSGPLIDLRSRGGFKLFQFMPIHRTAFLTGFGMCRVLILVAFVLLLIGGGLAVYAGLDAAADAAWGMMTLLVTLGTIAFLAAGLALAGVVTSNTLASAVINFVNLPIMFLSDLFIPLSMMPEAVQEVARFSPIYLLADAMRGAADGPFTFADAAPALIGLATLFAVACAVIATTFRWRLAR